MSLKLNKILFFVIFFFKLIASETYKYFALTSDYQIIRQKLNNFRRNIIAESYYYETVNQTGWNILKTYTNKQFSDDEQLYAAGILESEASWEIMFDAYVNYFRAVLNSNPLTKEQQQYVTNQTSWIWEQIGQNRNDPFWQIVSSIMQQLQGLYVGYNNAIYQNNKTEYNLTFDQFYYLTNMGDLNEITKAFEKVDKTELNCNAYVKLTKDDLICAHSTFNNFSLMLRIYKYIQTNLHNQDVKSNYQSFSSRPGDLQSKDDFYTLESGLVVMETSLNNYNITNYEYLHYDSLPCWLRVNVANRLAKNASQWAEIFGRYQSGTHNNQWLIVDYNQYRKNSTKDIVWMVEESFNLYKAYDMTDLLLKDGYVASYNVPYDQEIYQRTNYSQYGFNYTNDDRAILFKKHSQNVTNTKDVMEVIRFNRNETGDVCLNTLQPRCDLLGQNPYLYGGIDGKVTNNELMKKNQVLAVSGPTSEGLGYFDWRKWESAPHQGMPELFNFNWISIDLNKEQVAEEKEIKISL